MRGGRLVAVLLALALVASLVAAIGTAGAQETGGTSQGITPKEIRVGGVVGKTNPIGRPYADAFAGAKAYFAKVNKAGGVNGRKLKMVAELDDQSRASQNVAAARSLVEEKKVFAVLPVVTSIFAGASYLSGKGIPTFGWNINAEWSKGPNLFGGRGSWICFTCPTIAPVFIAKQIGAKKAAILSYSSPQSADCAKGQEAAYEKYGPELVFKDTSLSYGFTDLSADVQQIKEKGVDFISTCMDVNGEVNIARALRQAGVKGVSFYAPEGYDPKVAEKFGKDLNGIYFVIDFWPFEAAKGSAALRQYMKAMKKIGKEPNEQSLTGWVNAALLVEGLKAAGPNPTWESVTAAINQITDFTAGGLRPSIDWTEAHTTSHRGCAAYMEAKDGKFVLRFAKPSAPFVCFPENPYPDTLDAPEISAK